MIDRLKGLAKRFVRKKLLALIGKILASTAWLWIPILILGLGSLFIYVILFEMPQEAVHNPNLSDEERASAFFFGSTEYDIELFDRYKTVAELWDGDLTDEEKNQVRQYGLTWEWLAQVDRGINDPAFLSLYQGSDEIEFIPQPENTFEIVRPRFEFETHIFRKEEQVCIEHEEISVVLNEETDEDEEVIILVYEIETNKSTSERSLLKKAETMEGTYEHVWQEKEVISKEDSSCGELITKITDWELVEINVMIDGWLPLRNMLADLGVTLERDYEFWIEYWTRFLYASHEGGLSIDNFIPVERDFAWPTTATRISSSFGGRIHPIYQVWMEHKGVDIAAGNGSPIYAAQDGIVTFAGELGTAGNAIIIRHEGFYETRYYHLSSIEIEQGAHVLKEQKIGEVGKTGDTTGYHLHFEIRLNGTPVDPLDYYR